MTPQQGQHMPQQHQQQQQQFMAQRPPYSNMQGGPAPNVTMGQMVPSGGGGYGQPQQMQGMARQPHMGQQQMGQQQMQQQQMLQRQLSGGKPQQQQQQQHNPYQQGPF
jgi:hypothetical protein